MNSIVSVAVVAALLGSALVGGVFFAFSSFVMKALARLPSKEGIAAMQSINVVVINPSFLGLFVGTAVLSVVVAALTLFEWSHPSALLLLCGAICYIAGTFLVTVMGNVPLNNQLAATEPTSPDAATLWEHYLLRWTRWNHLRTLAAFTAALFYIAGLITYSPRDHFSTAAVGICQQAYQHPTSLVLGIGSGSFETNV